jgi:outer membrane immunogenic protein
MMMKTFTTLLMSACIVAPVFAADMLRAPPSAAPVASSWSGFYVFGFGGYSGGRISPDDPDVFSTPENTFQNPKPNGGVFGFGGGYNWQYGAWVGGLEVDYGFSNEKEKQSASLPIFDDNCKEPCTAIGTTTLTLSSKVDALASARLRAGYLFMPNVLAYGTAGLAWGRSQVTGTKSDCFTGEPCEVTTHTVKANHFGWVAGGGLEFRLFDHVRLRGEYLHYDFAATAVAFDGPTTTFNLKARDDVARGALIWNY